jgi:hypothetical protein
MWATVDSDWVEDKKAVAVAVLLVDNGVQTLEIPV